MKIIQFRFINTNDISNEKFKWCSRTYEYPIILKFLEEIKPKSVHNTSAGYGIDLWKCPQQMIEELKIYNTTNSDILPTEDMNIKKFNIVFDEMKKHQVVLNISVLEHLPANQQIIALNNLWKNVEDGGYLVVTFDYPNVNLEAVENWVGSKCELKPLNAVNGSNSAFQQIGYAHLNFILLILKKE